MSKKFDNSARRVGYLVYVYTFIGASLILLLVGAGVNPTLILSPIAAPVWIVIIISAWKIAKAIVPPK